MMMYTRGKQHIYSGTNAIVPFFVIPTGTLTSDTEFKQTNVRCLISNKYMRCG